MFPIKIDEKLVGLDTHSNEPISRPFAMFEPIERSFEGRKRKRKKQVRNCGVKIKVQRSNGISPFAFLAFSLISINTVMNIINAINNNNNNNSNNNNNNLGKLTDGLTFSIL